MKWVDLINRAARNSSLCSRGQDLDSGISADIFETLKFMLSKWSGKGLLPPAIVQLDFNLITGQAIYTMGPNGNFPQRPIELLMAYLTNASLGLIHEPIDIEQWAFYKGETLPSTLGMPKYIALNSTFPQATLATYPTPDQTYTLAIFGRFPWEAICPEDEIVLPPGFDDTICDNITVRIGQDYNFAIDPEIKNRAADGYASLCLAAPTNDTTKSNRKAGIFSRRGTYNWLADSPR